MLNLSPRWLETYPEAHVGLLALHVAGDVEDRSAFQQAKEALEARLRERYAGYDRERFRNHPTLAAYDAYYSRFRKTYHVLLQLKTVVFKERPISAPSPLVEAMFMAELDHLLLTAGHDLDCIEGNVVADVAGGEEEYERLGGKRQRTKSQDMMIRDEAGILSTVIYGPDQRTRIRPGTSRALFTTYAPRGIDPESIRKHLTDIEGYVALLTKEVRREQLQVCPPGA